MPVPASGKKLDCTTSSRVQAHVNDLWPLVSDLARWPAWMRDPRGRSGLARLTRVGGEVGKIDPHARTGGRYRLEFTNGFAGDWEVTYWLDPAQLSLRLLPDTRKESRGIEHAIIDLDVFPRGAETQLWFGALLILERGQRPSRLARWPGREVRSWVEGFHQRVAEEAAGRPRGKAAEALAREAP